MLGAGNANNERGRVACKAMSKTMALMIADFDPSSPDFAARRAAARKELDAIDPAMQGKAYEDPLRRAWFDEVYARAGDDPARVPWADLAPHPLTRAFLASRILGIADLRVLDVGCGLGDNAEMFAAAGAKVVAFDFVAQAVAWAKRRFPQSAVDYHAADLFTLPDEWRGAFDLVHECYTLQAISPLLLGDAFAAFANVLAPGGKLLIVARARDENADAAGPPWPLPPSAFDIAQARGFVPLAIEDVAATAEVRGRHWRALFQRAEAA
jgi:SAM-dependent methyltransferase